MPDLKAKIEQNIIHKHDFVQRLLPDHSLSEFRTLISMSAHDACLVLEMAEKCHASKLEAALKELSDKNAAVLKRFSQAG